MSSGKYVFHEQEIGDKFFMIVHGLCDVYVRSFVTFIVRLNYSILCRSIDDVLIFNEYFFVPLSTLAPKLLQTHFILVTILGKSGWSWFYCTTLYFNSLDCCTPKYQRTYVGVGQVFDCPRSCTIKTRSDVLFIVVCKATFQTLFANNHCALLELSIRLCGIDSPIGCCYNGMWLFVCTRECKSIYVYSTVTLCLCAYFSVHVYI